MRRGGWLLVALGWIGCGRLDFDARSPAGDAPGDAVPAPDCFAAWRSGAPALAAPEPIAAVNTAFDEGDPAPTSDGLTLYFGRGSSNGDYEQLYRATRATPADAFGAGSPVTELDGGASEKIAFDADQSHAILSANYGSGFGDEDLWTTTLANGVFSAPDEAPLREVDDGAHQLDPWLSPDGQRLYYSYFDSAQSYQDLVVSGRPTPAADFAGGQAITVAGALANTADPSPTPDELALLFSTRQVLGDPAHIALATRATTGDSYVSVGLVPALMSTGEDRDPALSADGCTLYFSSTRAGSRDLYTAQVTPP